MDIVYRQLRGSESAFLEEMLYEALFVPAGQPPLPKSIIDTPEIRKYLYLPRFGLKSKVADGLIDRNSKNVGDAGHRRGFLRPRTVKRSRDYRPIQSVTGINNWDQKEGDLAFVAELENELIGAVWGRKFAPENKGYGYVNSETPEVSLAIKEPYRNRGIGTALMMKIEERYAQTGVKNLSLSVDKRSPANAFYRRNGYTVYEENGTAFTMIKRIAT